MICKRCIYDDKIPFISFNSEGICNYCIQHDELVEEYPGGNEGWKKLSAIAQEIKKAGRKKKYDVVIGVSGGTDSSYMLHLAKKELGLRPLAAHFDNTWNSKIAVENINNVTKKLNIDLFTHVVDNIEYNDIFKSFLKASVPEIDIPADISLATTHYLAARKFGVKYIFEGHSFKTEGITPHGWVYMDAKYIKSVQKKFGTLPIKTLPNLWLHKWLKWIIINRIKKIRPLYYLDYSKEDAKKLLAKEYDWKDYGGHHMENRTAYFANNYYLPKKFNIDLRLPALSAQIRSNQISRQEALNIIKNPKIFDEGIITEIKKRLKLSDKDFNDIMNLPLKTYRNYKTYKKTFEKMRSFFYLMAKMDLIPMSFYIKYTSKSNI